MSLLRTSSVAARAAALAWVLLAACGAHAQAPQEAQAERARISAERSRHETAFAAERAACYQKFAVTQCLNDVRSRRRDVIADLKRQEVAVNDAERKRVAAEQVRALDARRAAADTARGGAVEREAAAADDQRVREQRQADKQTERAARTEQAARREATQRLQVSRPTRTSAERAAADARAADGLQQREREAEDRKAKRQAQNENRKKPAGKPLPVPP